MLITTVYSVRLDESNTLALREFQSRAKRIHRSLPSGHPARVSSGQLSYELARLHFRGIRIEDLAKAIEISHQAVRARIQSVSPISASDFLIPKDTKIANQIPENAVLVTDSGIHRRLTVHKQVPVGLLLAPLPVIEDLDTFISWLDSSSGETPLAVPSATPLRTTPVFVSNDLVAERLVEL